jgi:creatinine amidohydrolase
VEPAHFKVVHEAARAAAERTRARIVVPDHRRKPLVEKLGREFVSGGSHAGLYETSLMLAAAPGLVREDIRSRLPALEIDLPGRIKAGARDFHECGGHDAYFGEPASASAEEGVRLLDLLAEFTAQALQAP